MSIFHRHGLENRFGLLTVLPGNPLLRPSIIGHANGDGVQVAQDIEVCHRKRCGSLNGATVSRCHRIEPPDSPWPSRLCAILSGVSASPAEFLGLFSGQFRNEGTGANAAGVRFGYCQNLRDCMGGSPSMAAYRRWLTMKSRTVDAASGPKWRLSPEDGLPFRCLQTALSIHEA